MDQIMKKEDQIKQIMKKVGTTCNGRPYHYKMNNKNRVIVDREGLASNEEEVEDIWVNLYIHWDLGSSLTWVHYPHPGLVTVNPFVEESNTDPSLKYYPSTSSGLLPRYSQVLLFCKTGTLVQSGVEGFVVLRKRVLQVS
jgi:hypothetical protein